MVRRRVEPYPPKRESNLIVPTLVSNCSSKWGPPATAEEGPPPQTPLASMPGSGYDEESLCGGKAVAGAVVRVGAALVGGAAVGTVCAWLTGAD